MQKDIEQQQEDQNRLKLQEVNQLSQEDQSTSNYQSPNYATKQETQRQLNIQEINVRKRQDQEIENLFEDQNQSKKYKTIQQKIWQSQYTLDSIVQFLKKHEIGILQQVNNHFNKYKYKFNKLEINKYNEDEHYVQNKIE